MREVVLEENDNVINVAPSVRADTRGGFLVADYQEAQVRKYRDDGSLEYAFGSKGGGPAEFVSAIAALRTASGEILAVDAGGTSKIISPAGDSLVSTFPNPRLNIDDIDLLTDGTVLYSGRSSNEGDERLHVVELPTGRIVRSFFTPTIPEQFRMAAAMAGLTNADVRNDTIAVVFALTDSIYLFTPNGVLHETLKIPSRHYRSITDPAPSGQSARAINEWMSSFSLISAVHWRSDGGFVIQYQDRENLMPRWHVLGMSRSGQWQFEETNRFKVLLVDDVGSRVIVVSPDAEVPNRWSIGEFAQQ